EAPKTSLMTFPLLTPAVSSNFLNPVLFAAQVAQKFLAPSRQVTQLDDAALGQKTSGEQTVPMMDRQIDSVPIVCFVSFLRMMFAGADQRDSQVGLQFRLHRNPPRPGALHCNRRTT